MRCAIAKCTRERLTRLVCLTCLSFAPACFAQNGESMKHNDVVAIVAGERIYESDLVPSIQAQLLKLQGEQYNLERRALDGVLEQRILESAAKQEGITTENLLARQVDAKVAEPTDLEVQAYYSGQGDKSNRPFDEVKDQMRAELRRATIQHARQDYLKKLLTDSRITILLTPPRMTVSYDPGRLLGSPKASVMIIEFADFQCPYCHRVEPTLKQLLAKYGDQVSLAYRDFPLEQMHSQAESAAEASRCAGEQGEFWEYHDLLLSSSKLERADLLGYARALKLDENQFATCLTTGKFKGDIQRDIEEGKRLGVSGTPQFFVNGIPFSGAHSAEAFTRIIDEELAR